MGEAKRRNQIMEAQKELRKKFISDAQAIENPRALVTAVQLPSGAIEVITNQEHIESKINDLMNRYDDEFKLLPNGVVKIVGYMLV
jgi:hypothetical protein